MKVLFASSEVFPFSKTGGLADVSGALPLALSKLNVEISVITPLYKCVKDRFSMEDPNITFDIPISSKTEKATLKKLTYKNVPIFFVENDNYFYRDGLYTDGNRDYQDNAERFIFFSKAITEFAISNNFDIVHLNDWQTALTSVFLKKVYEWNGKIVLTIHNLGYQGIFWAYDMHLTNLSWEYFNPNLLEFWGNINFLKGGIYTADAITTVSPRYAEEILNEEFGFGLDGVLRDVKHKIHGILNGIDYEEWSPETDKFIIKNFDYNTVTEAKKECKKDLLNSYGLGEDIKKPAFGIISRMVIQKGWDIIIQSLENLLEDDIYIVALGSGEKEYEEKLKELQEKYKNKLGVKIGYDNGLAHKIEAGADFFIMPSKYEPCGLNQMISFKYGTIPIINPVGGLYDTVVDIDDRKNGNGIRMKNYSTDELINSIRRAQRLFKNPLELSRIRKKIMKLDYSWTSSAMKYLELYRRLLENEF
ncbi:MAG: glycogen synthase GlgA [Proteobacteria bacterium]|nr:glycogen synthase GlgA [Pseudomonadota bacterium]